GVVGREVRAAAAAVPEDPAPDAVAPEPVAPCALDTWEASEVRPLPPARPPAPGRGVGPGPTAPVRAVSGAIRRDRLLTGRLRSIRRMASAALRFSRLPTWRCARSGDSGDRRTE